MKTSHKIFFAIPFDSATRTMYDRVATVLRVRFPSLVTVIGTNEIGPSPKYSTITSFKSQNRELTSQFIAQIRDADIVVADLTHNNPNVHVELGVALMENKNILRVTGRSLTELGFDVRNLEVRAYKDEKVLTKTIIAYLSTFFAIKRLNIAAKHGKLYRRLPTPLSLSAPHGRLDLQPKTPQSYIVRDGAVRATFEITNVESDVDWFGIYFRGSENPLLGSHLLYVRRNGAVELALYPGPHIIEKFSLPGPISGRQTVLVEFENEELNVRIGKTRFTSSALSHQTAGRIWCATWQADVTVISAEMISRDTVEWR